MSVKCMEWVFGGPILGSEDTQSLCILFFENRVKTVGKLIHYSTLSADLENGHWQGLANEKIEKVCIYRQGSTKSLSYHAITILKTKNYYYSLERLMDHISIQRSTAITDVAEEYNLKPRIGDVSREIDWVDCKGSVWDVINFLLDSSGVFHKKFNFFTRNCQEFTAQIYDNFNIRGLKFKKYRQQRSPRPLGVGNQMDVFSGIDRVIRFSKLL